MLKKCLLFILMFCMGITLVACDDGKDQNQVIMDNWTGSYIWEDEETQEFKTLEIEHKGENKIHIVCKSAKSVVEFQGEAKSQTGRYIAVNLGPKSLKVTLSSSYKSVEIDDMWTGDNPDERVENWSGRYRRLEEGELFPKFGTADWNGKYICEENGQIVSVYGVKERYVLFAYESVEEDGTLLQNNLVCLESDPTRAVYTKDERLVMIDIVKANDTLEITDMYMDDMENTGISGIYKKYVPENTDEQ